MDNGRGLQEPRGLKCVTLVYSKMFRLSRLARASWIEICISIHHICMGPGRGLQEPRGLK